MGYLSSVALQVATYLWSLNIRVVEVSSTWKSPPETFEEPPSLTQLFYRESVELNS